MPPDAPTPGAPVAIAIVSWNTRDLLGACLDSIAPEVERGCAEAWVVDNGSGDGSANLVREQFSWANLLEPGSNIGFGSAVNLVAERTSTPWIAPANADVELTPGALDSLLLAGQRDRCAGIVSPRLVLPDGSTQHSVYSFPTLAFAALFNFGISAAVPGLSDRLLLEGHWDATRARRVDWAIGAFLLVRRTAWESVGGFDREQWMYAEDLDLGWRLSRAGWTTRYEPAAVVRHHGSASTIQEWGDERDVRWMRSTYRWMLCRRGARITRSFAVINIIGAGARAVLAMLGSRLSPGRWSYRRAFFLHWTRIHLIGLGSRRRLMDQR